MATQTLEKPTEQEPPLASKCPLTLKMMAEAAEAGLRLEYLREVGGIWELMPSFFHQQHSFRIQSSITPSENFDGKDCGCIHGADVAIQFPDGSIKRPDIAIWCETPATPHQTTPTLPEVVIEVVSPDYEDKDYTLGVAFYRRFGIADIVVFDPKSGDVLHINAAGEQHHTSPVTLTFACGCTCVV